MFERRLIALCLPFAAFFAVLTVRLFTMQVLEADEWREEASRLARRVLRTPARRGALLDRSGTVLVEDRLQMDLAVRLDRIEERPFACGTCGRPAWSAGPRPPRRCPDCGGSGFAPRPAADFAALRLFLPAGSGGIDGLVGNARAAFGRDVDAETARRTRDYGRAERRDAERILAAREYTVWPDVPPEVVRAVALDPEGCHGFVLKPVHRRVVTGGDCVARLVGRTGPLTQEEGARLREEGRSWTEIWRMEVGRSGLEKGLEERLRCREGRRQVKRDERGRILETLSEEPPVDGEDVRLSLDLLLQQSVTALLAEACRREGAEGGAFVALVPATGEVVVLASHGEGDLTALNLAVTPAVPGSVFKILTALAALSTEGFDPRETFTCAGPWHGISCTHDHGDIDLEQAISHSCNKYFAALGERLGIDVLEPFAARLGFGRPAGLGLPEELGGLVPGPAWKRRRHPADPVLHPGEVRQFGFGHGALMVTPVQVARLMAVVASGGRLPAATLVAGEGGAGEPVVSARAATIVGRGMVATVEEGTGRDLGLSEFRTAGKTGTAEVVAGQKVHMGWFAGYAPAEAPRVAFACYLRKVRSYGADAAGPVVAGFLREYLKR